MENTGNFVGDKIRHLRESLGISQNELAGKVGLSQKAMSQIETGKTQARRSTMVAIAEVLKVAVDYFQGPERSTRPSPRLMKALIEEAADTLPYAAVALMVEQFAKECAEIRASVLAILYGDETISEPYLSGKAQAPVKAK